MPVYLKDYATVKRELQSDLATILPQASQSKNSAIVDVLVNPNAVQFSFLHNSLQTLIDSTQLNTVSGSDLDKYASNYSIIRKTGTAAQGSVFFVLDNSFDQQRDIEILSNKIVSATTSSGTVSFKTLISLSLRREDKAVYAAVAEANRSRFVQAGILDAIYAVEVPIQATVTGVQGLVGSYSITTGAVNNVTNIVNLGPTTGGFESETDAALRQRIALSISGNSVGTIDGVKAAALSVTGTLSAFVVTPGSPLMVRDGSVYDEKGNLLQEGRGNTIDVYVFGETSTDALEQYTFKESTASSERFTLSESIILGTAESMTRRKQPVLQMGSVVGTLSGSNFTLATPTTDSEGNTILEGHVAFIKDFEASKYTIVRNVATNELAIASHLNPNSTKYVSVQSLTTSAEANSTLGQDRLIFLRKYALIDREVVARGRELNGADPLKYSDVIGLQKVEEDVKVDRELVTVASDGAFIIQTRHSPIVSVSQVRHARLGTTFTSTIADATTGKISLVGRFAPQSGDLIEVSYVWRKSYLKAFEYYPKEDSISWIQPDYVIESNSLTIYDGTLPVTLTPTFQPLTPTFLSLDLSNAIKRAQYNLIITGDIADIYSDFTPSFQRGIGPSLGDSDAYVFANGLFARLDSVASHIGRVTRLRNVTKGYDYNLFGYKLQTNRYATDAEVNSNLSKTQFSISEKNNLTFFSIGDQVKFNAPMSNASWSSAEELTNNIRGNLQPIYDATKILIDQKLAEIQLAQPETNPNLADTIADLNIVLDTTWSGRMRVTGDVTIKSGATLTIEAGTVVTFVASGDLPAVTEVKQRIKLLRSYAPLSPVVPPIIYKALHYLFLNTVAPFFVIMDDLAESEYIINYNSDLISKEKNSSEEIVYRVNGNDLDKKYWTSLEKAIEKTGTLVSSFSDETFNGETQEVYTSYDIVRYGNPVYIVPLENDPREISPSVFDILLRDTNDKNNTVVVEYEPTLGKYAVIPILTNTSVAWQLEFGVTIVKRLVMKVDGILDARGQTENPITFTSAATAKRPGDWGGIIFAPRSHSRITGSQSTLNNCIIKYTDTAIQILSSDPIIENCIVKKFLSAGGISRNEPITLGGYTEPDYILTSSMFVLNAPQRIRELGKENIPTTFPVVSTITPSPYGPCGYGYGYGYGYDGCGSGINNCQADPKTPSKVISGAYISFSLPSKPIPAADYGSGIKIVATLIPVSEYRAVFDFSYGIDYTLFVNGEDITSKPIETFKDCSQAYLIPGVDFNLEMDLTKLKAQVVFYNTLNFQAFLHLYASSPLAFSISYNAVMNAGSIKNNLFYDSTNPAWIAQSGSDIVLTNNTFYRTGPVAIKVAGSYCVLRNNIIAEYSLAGLVKDEFTLAVVEHNNINSSIIVAGEPHRPIDTDSLIKDLEIDDIVLPVTGVSKYQPGIFLKIDNEFLEVEQVGLEVRVKRGAFESIKAKHLYGARVLLLRRKTFFTITGIPGTNVQLLITDSKGKQLATNPPVSMIQIEDNTFRTAIPVDRLNTVFYCYRYWTDNPLEYTETELRKIEVLQFGDAVNDFYSLSISEKTAVKGNYSVDPRFVNEIGEDFSLQADSPSNSNNPIYTTPWNPSVAYNSYLGIIPREELQLLIENTKTVKLAYPLLASGSLIDSITILNVSTRRKILPASYNPEKNEVTLVSPINLRNVGNYTISYNSPTSLGTSQAGNPNKGTIQYQFDAKRIVEFLKFEATSGGEGGKVRVAFRVSNRKDTLPTLPFSQYYEMVGGEILFPAATTGSIIDLLIEIQGNDGSYNRENVYMYPKLQDFSVTYAPEVDTQEYVVKDVLYQTKTGRTRVYLDPPNAPGMGITETTATTLAGISGVAANIKKQGTVEYFQIAQARSLNAGDKYVDLLGNFSIAKLPPALDDVVVADLSYISQGSSEILSFINSSTQLTTNRFEKISSITTDIVLDRVSQIPGGEKLKVDITNQPKAGVSYNVSYSFEAPKNNEVLNVSFAYNALMQSVQTALENKKDALADVLGKEMYSTPITISANVVLTAGFNVTEVISGVTQAITEQFSTFIANNPMGGGRIDATDTLAVIKSVNGVDDLSLTQHHRPGYTGVTNIELTTREFPTFDETSPQITVVAASDPNTTLSLSQ